MTAMPDTDPVPIRPGDASATEERIPLARPRVLDPEGVQTLAGQILRSGTLTNGPLVRTFEERAARYLGVQHCVAVSSCTAGLMLALRASGLAGDVLIPSFTFAATAHAVAWNGLRPVFVDIEADTLTMSPDSVERAIRSTTAAILATHIFGTPCRIEELQDIAERHDIRLLFDAAHAFGSRHSDAMVGGFGDAEVFSLSPTKVLFAGEGGLIATNDDELAEHCRIGRDYGNPGDYDCRFVGLNARMSEFHAAVALASFEDLEERLDERQLLAGAYRDALAGVPGVSFPSVIEGDRSTIKDLTILIDPEVFGLGPDDLATALDAAGIETKRYYAPPVHSMQAYAMLESPEGDLAVTDDVASRTLTLPLWGGMGTERIERVVQEIRRTRVDGPAPRI